MHHKWLPTVWVLVSAGSSNQTFWRVQPGSIKILVLVHSYPGAIKHLRQRHPKWHLPFHSAFMSFFWSIKCSWDTSSTVWTIWTAGSLKVMTYILTCITKSTIAITKAKWAIITSRETRRISHTQSSSWNRFIAFGQMICQCSLTVTTLA